MPSSACDWSSDVCSSDRSEEHTSELQSRSDLVCRLLLEKKKKIDAVRINATQHQEQNRNQLELQCVLAHATYNPPLLRAAPALHPRVQSRLVIRTRARCD